MNGRFANMSTDELIQARLARDISAADAEEIQQELLRRRAGREPRPGPARGAPEERAGSERELVNVRVLDFDMPFWGMVVFMLKWTFAAIPAMLILFAAAVAIWVLAGGALATLLGPR
ncbi:MAG TPA: hypothetical protein VJ803_06220 [Gemmatimonadaceae bacterium]|nr:hypothetical protein [Gemmatimonadaceae bacterium]